MHAMSKEIEHMYEIKYLFTIVNDFVHLFHPKPVQNIITIKLTMMSPIFGGWENLTRGDQ